MNTLTNSFHNTEVHTRLSDEDLAYLKHRLANGTATSADRQTTRRLHDALCGSHDGECGDEFGRRP